MEFITRTTPPRLGNLVLHPPKPKKIESNLAVESTESVVVEALQPPSP